MLASLAKFAPAVLGKVADCLIPGAGSVVQQLHQWYLDKREATEKAEILKALRITEEKLNAFDNMFMLLGRDCLQLLERVDALEKQGRDATDEIAREVLNRPELQSRFDAIGSELAKLDGRVNALEADVKKLDERYASLGAYAGERANQLSETELADFREFRKAKQFQSAGQFAESEPILLKLANTQPQSAAVAVAQAVARHDQPQAFDASLKRAVRLRPDDANLRALASAATVAVTGRNTPAARPTPPVGRVPKPGDTLDGWALEQRLGGGGWGIVFRASKRGATKALKVMRPDLSDHAEFVEAFHEESLKLNRLRHANVVAVERIGFCRDFQCPYFAMPLLDGLNLEQHLAEHGVPSAEVAMGWLTGLLDGLEHAHAKGLIHRDIKPQNVMIQPDGRAVLIDFGIAGLADVEGHTQALGMSRQFAPPEQVSVGAADLRADLYSLAATIFYALRYDSPAERLAHEYEPEAVPEPFRAAFDAALSRKPSKRPASAGRMRDLLVPSSLHSVPRTDSPSQKTGPVFAPPPADAALTPSQTPLVVVPVPFPLAKSGDVSGTWYSKPTGDPSGDWQFEKVLLTPAEVLPDRVFQFVAGPETGDRGLAAVAEMASMIPITAVNLSPTNRVTATGLASLRALTELAWLEVNFAGQPADAGLEEICHFRKLRHLTLHRCGELTDAGCAPLVGLSGLISFTAWKLTRVTDGGMAPLSRLRSLETIGLAGAVAVTDAGLRSLAALPSLKVLTLLGCPNVTANGLALFTRLESLNVYRCIGISPLDERRIRHDLPAVRVIHIAEGASGRQRGQQEMIAKQLMGSVTEFAETLSGRTATRVADVLSIRRRRSSGGSAIPQDPIPTPTPRAKKKWWPW